MTCKLIIALILINCLTAIGQKNIELFGGYSLNRFHDYKNDEGYYRSTYEPGKNGYSFSFGIENVRIDWLKMRLTLRYDKYDGEIEAINEKLSGGYTTQASIDKSVISFGLFPLNFKILKKVDLNFGISASGLIHEKFTGTSSGWSMPSNSWEYELQEEYDRFSNKIYFGLNSRIAYDFKIADDLFISPQYQIYYGISDEFIVFPESTKSMRHYFCIGIEKIIHPKPESE